MCGEALHWSHTKTVRQSSMDCVSALWKGEVLMNPKTRLRLIKRLHRRKYTRFDIALSWEPWETLEGPCDNHHDICDQVSRSTNWFESFPSFETPSPKRTVEDVELLRSRLQEVDDSSGQSDEVTQDDLNRLLDRLRKSRIKRAAELIREKMMY